MQCKTAFIGGIFVYSEDPKSLAEWYETHFGMKHEFTPDYNAHYISYEYNELITGHKRYVAWSILKSKDKRPKDLPKTFSINLRVDDLTALLGKLEKQGIPFKGPEVHDEGSFAWLQDPDGNYLELWQDVEIE